MINSPESIKESRRGRWEMFNRPLTYLGLVAVLAGAGHIRRAEAAAVPRATAEASGLIQPDQLPGFGRGISQQTVEQMEAATQAILADNGPDGLTIKVRFIGPNGYSISRDVDTAHQAQLADMTKVGSGPAVSGEIDGTKPPFHGQRAIDVSNHYLVDFAETSLTNPLENPLGIDAHYSVSTQKKDIGEIDVKSKPGDHRYDHIKALDLTRNDQLQAELEAGQAVASLRWPNAARPGRPEHLKPKLEMGTLLGLGRYDGQPAYFVAFSYKNVAAQRFEDNDSGGPAAATVDGKTVLLGPCITSIPAGELTAEQAAEYGLPRVDTSGSDEVGVYTRVTTAELRLLVRGEGHFLDSQKGVGGPAPVKP